MGDGTKIEWTDATLNVVNGCSVISPGCANCYAMRSGARGLPHHPSTGLTRPTKNGHVWTGELRFNEAALELPLRWTKPKKIFWNAHGDLFHEDVPVEWIDKCFAVMAATPQHIHQVLTKRPERMREYARQAMGSGEHWLAHCERSHAPMWPLPNVWLGTSVEDQLRAEQRIPPLLLTPAAVRFLSCEPLLGPIDFSTLPLRSGGGTAALYNPLSGEHSNCQLSRTPRIHWVICGGESGRGARPMNPVWVELLMIQCDLAGVPFLFKQWGDWAPAPPDVLADLRLVHEFADGQRVGRFGKTVAGRSLGGRHHDGFPEGAINARV
ncbi:MAG: phage Gp37/Gp68 family protein [Pseudomonadota bacterium]